MPVELLITPVSITAVLNGEIDHHCAASIRDEIDRSLQIQAPPLLRLDFGDVSFIDSSAVGLVMGRYRLMRELGGRMQVVNLSPRFYKVMQMAGLEKLATLTLRKEQGKEIRKEREEAI